MRRSSRALLCALSIFVASACEEDAPDERVVCPPPCAPAPVQVGDAGTSTSAGDGGTPAATGPDAAGAPGAPLDAGGSSSSDADSDGDRPSAADASSDASAIADASADAGAGADSGPRQTLPPITDYSQRGPFQTTMESNVGPGSRYTIFRPETLGENGFLHPPIIWGPGIGTRVTSYTTLLSNVASHGFVVVAVNSLSSGPGAEANRRPMLEGLDWIIAQNDQSGVYQGKLDVRRAVSMGYSIGGTAAVQVGAHPSVITTVSIHGHSATAALHGPLLQTTGTADTIGLPLQQDTYDASTVQTFLATLSGATHTEILASGGGRERAPIVAWLRFWVFDDQGARSFFYGDDCTLCVAPWTNPQRKNWK